jgi:hypothetical protein
LAEKWGAIDDGFSARHLRQKNNLHVLGNCSGERPCGTFVPVRASLRLGQSPDAAWPPAGSGAVEQGRPPQWWPHCTGGDQLEFGRERARHQGLPRRSRQDRCSSRRSYARLEHRPAAQLCNDLFRLVSLLALQSSLMSKTYLKSDRFNAGGSGPHRLGQVSHERA